MKQFAVATLLAATHAAAAPPPAPAPPRDSPAAPSPKATSVAPLLSAGQVGPVPSAAPAAAAGLPLAPPSSVQPRKPSEEYTPNVVLLVLAGGALGAGGMFAGGYLGYKLDCAADCRGEFRGLGGLLLGGAIGLTVGSTTGIMLTGIDGEHHSSVGLTWLGTAIGGTLGAVAAAKSSDSLVGATFLLASGSALGGTLLYYAARSKNRPAPAIRLQPYTDGSVMGVALGNTF